MIWIVGSQGMLGKELSSVLEKAGVPCMGSDKDVDVRDPSALESFVSGRRVSMVVNCAAYTNVDRAEEDSAVAWELNAAGPRNLAKLCHNTGARLVHISTDYVFDGSAARPYVETDAVCPLGVYGKTKADGEAMVLKEAPDSVILRTAWLYGQHGKNFVNTMVRLFHEQKDIKVVSDQRGSPTWARDLADAILYIYANSEFEAGLYHFSGDGDISWYEFAVEIARLAILHGLEKHKPEIIPISSDEYPTKALRPKYSVLCKDKIRKSGISIPNWKMSLDRYVRELAALESQTRN